MTTIPLDLSPIGQLTRDQFYRLCAANPDHKLERNAHGEVIVLSPTGGETGFRNFNLAGQLFVWNQTTKLGIAFDSSTGFSLPEGGDRSPDYRLDQPVEILSSPSTLSGETVLPGFELDVAFLWE